MKPKIGVARLARGNGTAAVLLEWEPTEEGCTGMMLSCDEAMTLAARLIIGAAPRDDVFREWFEAWGFTLQERDS